MPTHVPIAAVGSREPDKRPQPIPAKVRAAVLLMVYGREDDEDCKPLDLVEAAQTAGMKPSTMRKYLTRPSVMSLIRAERKAFREAVCCGNEAALKRVRDKSANGMVTVAAVRALQELDSDEHARPSANVSCGVVIRVINSTPNTALPAPMVDVTPIAPATDRAEPATSDLNPIFKPRQPPY
jgi:hypothetical protein